MPTENKTTPFEREERYVVIKLSKLQTFHRGLLIDTTRTVFQECLVDALVIESDWPEYEPGWQMIERRMTGQPPVTAEELDAVLHWRAKHAQAIRERDALQVRLNAAPAMHPFAEKVVRKLERFQECADDGQGADIGRHWFDLLTQLGLLNRVQRSPALWEMTQQGEDALELSRQNAKSR
ncbi:hypothetical protein HBR94_14215 [Pseudomonas sp. WS 5412]|uniref:hypothetical protein n=1 Tax=Pseudomonas TaxID=286 RepID=UPI000E01130D|nr:MULTISPECIES: hypothetical protein [Pseudomonas]MCU0212550.1 hypothetical protein [Pseudomonas shahriarae]NMY21001.1 hypothetical protein [Pseudomonas sp. WS 5410]NMY32653.1 hypothetical protein [Pseudomonas sp. WS 5412]SUD43753.1 Uncharacterised protein [Pseudomonas fluorescens]